MGEPRELALICRACVSQTFMWSLWHWLQHPEHKGSEVSAPCCPGPTQNPETCVYFCLGVIPFHRLLEGKNKQTKTKTPSLWGLRSLHGAWSGLLGLLPA